MTVSLAVRPVSTQEYAAGAGCTPAPRPPREGLDLTTIEATGIVPRDQWEALADYVAASD